MKIRANQIMKKLYPNGIVQPIVDLPGELYAIVNSGVVEKNECYLSKSLLIKSQSVNEDDFPDKTGYECFVNHLHIDDFAANDYFNIAYAFLISLRKILQQEVPNCSFRGIISIDEMGCSVRFHKIRDQESWCSEDLDSYHEEGICVIDL